KFTAGQLERLEDRQHLFDTRDGLQRFGLQLVLVADDADDRAQLAAAQVRLESQLLNALHNVIDLLRGGVLLQHDNHGSASNGPGGTGLCAVPSASRNGTEAGPYRAVVGEVSR